MKLLLRSLTLLLVFTWSLSYAGDGVKFIQNKGQWNNKVEFKADIKGGVLYLEKNKLTFDLFNPKTFNRYIRSHHEKSTHRNFNQLDCHSYHVEFVGGNLAPSISGKYKTPEYYNYFLGNDKSKWASNVYGYHQVDYKNIYTGISLTIYSSEDLKYDLIVNPLANVKDIQLKYNGVDAITLNNGQIHIKTSVNKIIEEKPYAYQYVNGEKQEVECNYTLKNNIIGFDFPNSYDKEIQLIIDPTLIFSAYTESRANNFGYTATSDSKGFLYSGSSAFGSSFDYPTTIGAYSINFNGGIVDIAISKFDTTGTFMIYSTYLGGDNDELPHSLIVNSFDELFVLGTTSSSNFPTTVAAFDTSFNGGTANDLLNGLGVNYTNGSDIVVSHLSTTGDALLASTYIGGSGNDGLNSAVAIGSPLNVLRYNYADEIRGEIDIDNNNNIYIISSTRSATDFPIIGNVFQPNYGGGDLDACLIKMDNSLQNIIWSSYLGGEKQDAGYSLALDDNDDIYVTGGTESVQFPTTNNAINPTFNGGRSDGFVTHITKDGQQVINSTFYGSPTYDQSYFVELDIYNNVYLFGQTEVTDNTFIKNVSWSERGSGQFISKLTPHLDSVMYSTVFGGGNGINISPTAFLVDLCSKIYLTGWGGSTNNIGILNNNAGNTTGMYTTPDAQQSSTDGNDFYIMVLEDDASGIFYGSYFGGNISSEHVDGGTSRFDRKGKVYQAMCAGCGGNSDMTIAPPNNPLDTNFSSCNLGVFKMDFEFPIVVADFDAPPIGCAPFTYTFNNTSLIQSNTNYYWNFGDGNTSTSANPSHTFNQSGTYTITLVLTDNATCNLADSLQKKIIILGDTSYSIANVAMCLGETQQIGILPSNSPSITYLWSPSTYLSDHIISNPFVTPDATTTYSLIISNGVCSDTITQAIQLNNPTLETSNDTTLCNNESVQLLANSFGTSSFFVWSSNSQFTDTLNSTPTDSTISVSPLNSTWYFVIATFNNCFTIDSVLVNYLGYTTTVLNDTICEGNSTPLNIAVQPAQSLNHNWSPLASIVSGANTANPIVNPTLTTTFFDTTANTFGCIVIDSLTIEVIPKLTITGGNTRSTCDTATLDIIITGQYNNITWSTNNGFTDTLNTNPLATSLLVDVKGNTWFYVMATNEICAAADSFLVNYIGFDLNTIDTNICNGESVTIETIPTPSQTLTYNWSPTLAIISGENTATITVNPTATTVYTVIAQNNLGCIDSTTSSVFVSGFDPNLLTIFADKDTLINGESTQLHILPNTGFTYQWDPSSFLNNPTISEPITTPLFTTTITYTVTLTEIGTNCPYYKTITIYALELLCDEPHVFLPNAFTPNGDNENDILLVRGRTIKKMVLKIYDRWGELVFETNQQAIGWNGTYKDALVDPGVFVYHLQVTCIDGQEYFKKGNVTVIR
jgi:gliding motility-associated-like protein